MTQAAQLTQQQGLLIFLAHRTLEVVPVKFTVFIGQQTRGFNHV